MTNDRLVEHYRKALLIKPASSKIDRVDLGDRLAKRGKLDDAITAYHCQLQINKDPDLAYLRLGKILWSQSDFESAILCFFRAVENNINLDDAHYELQSICKLLFYADTTNPHTWQEVPHLQEILEFYDKAVKNHPRNALSHLILADLLTYSKKIAEAIQFYHLGIRKKILASPIPSHVRFAEQNLESENLGKPTFLIIGVTKGGTSSLYEYLTQHPNILPATNKEVIYGDPFQHGIEWYLSNFLPIPENSGFLTGEAGPNYYISPILAQKISNQFPNIKLILILRNPIYRTFSAYQMLVKYGHEKKDFLSILDAEFNFWENTDESEYTQDEFKFIAPTYTAPSVYQIYLKSWLKYFCKDQILILKSEDLYANPQNITSRVFDFIQVSNHTLPSYPNYNPGSYQSIDDNLYQKLSQFFQPHNRKLEELLGMEFNWN